MRLSGRGTHSSSPASVAAVVQSCFTVIRVGTNQLDTLFCLCSGEHCGLCEQVETWNSTAKSYRVSESPVGLRS